MPAVDCGIDIGSTNVKVVLVEDGGQVLLTRSQASPRLDDNFGPATDPLALVTTLEEMIIAAWRELRLGKPLRSITTAGIGEDGCGVTTDLRPTGHAVAWFDRRAAGEAEALQRFRKLAAQTGIHIDATLTAAKWLWLHRHRPAEMRGASAWLTLTDFPIAWWAGKTFMSCSLAPRTGCFDVHERNWNAELLSATHAPALPDVVPAGSIIGGVRQGPLRASGTASGETLLVAGGHDHPIAASLIRRMDGTARVDSLGTANLIYGETMDFTDVGLTEQIAFSLPPAGGGYACLGVIELSAALAGLQAMGEVRKLLSHHHLPGTPPLSLAELQSATAEPRRILEAMSLKARSMLAALDAAGVPQGRIYTTGGWSRSRAFVELRASCFGQPIIALGDLEMTALGAALFGAEAADCKTDLAAVMQTAETVEPVPGWAEAYGRFAEATAGFCKMD